MFHELDSIQLKDWRPKCFTHLVFNLLVLVSEVTGLNPMHASI